ncbi:hypothetical protein OG21DRAFT_849403 [Imleria badia]|nr:hypothetical protein OG21DRAFT_849403 [Imleria badia]
MSLPLTRLYHQLGLEQKKITEHQRDVYDFARTFPCGRVRPMGPFLAQVRTIDRVYAISEPALRSNVCFARIYARSDSFRWALVGSALRHNPFAPFVSSLHQISTLADFLASGVYCRRGRRAHPDKRVRKIKILAIEGVEFTAEGYLVERISCCCTRVSVEGANDVIMNLRTIVKSESGCGTIYPLCSYRTSGQPNA